MSHGLGGQKSPVFRRWNLATLPATQISFWVSAISARWRSAVAYDRSSAIWAEVVHGGEWTQAAAGWANATLCLMSYMSWFMSDQLSQNLPKFAGLVELYAADDQSEISFTIPQGTLPWQPFLSVLSAELMGVSVRHLVSSGAAGWRADVRLCLASSLLWR